MKKTSALIAAALWALAAGPASGQAMSPAEYLAASGASDLYERQSSQIVLQTSRDARVREFAAMMIDHHMRSTRDVTTAARRARIRPAPPRLMPLHAEMLAQLRAEQGPARDAAYVAQQKASHNQALEVQKAYAMEGRSAPLRNAAAGIVPVVEQHIAMLKAMP